eukprot:TRINITY_DN1815_c0_g1_i1.p1 TRINITY_DN1815_c0_g1~~TRINITY_DN1815_c0_g1_i1.p1  ORF type:complete len:325 (-),score=50.71 TRINITY_DN1815_c0_g1_i1:134-1078(-)
MVYVIFCIVLLSCFSIPTLGFSNSAGICPPQGQHKAAIAYLFPIRRIGLLKTSLESLFANFNDKYRYRVFLFHDEDCEAQAVSELQTSLTPRQMCLLRFYHITNQFPPGFDAKKALKKGVVYQSSFPGYNHMISFWWKRVFEHPKIRELEYFMRLDTESIIHPPPVPNDLFDVMKKGGFYYGYRLTMIDPEFVVKGLWRYYRKYVMKTPGYMPPVMASQFPKEKDLETVGAPSFYNNFEILYVPFFTKRIDVQAFIDTIYASHYIYTRRWGDAPLRYFLVNTFNATEHVRQFCEVNYSHFPASCFRRCHCKLGP